MPLKKRTRNIYDPASSEPFKLSRSKLEDFVKCPRCFYLDRRLGVGKPSMPGWTLNSAVDHLLKKEFDSYRERGEPHPLMTKYGIEAIPFTHPDLEEWRENFKGVQYLHPQTNLLITGAVDDIWINSQEELIVVDYKSTSKDGEVTLDDQYKEGYKRQAEIYQWLLRQNGFNVSDMSYFVYANADKALACFDGQLCFDVTIIPYEGDASWVEGAILEAAKCLRGEGMPEAGGECEYCVYRELARGVE